MSRKLIVVLLLLFALSACESTEGNTYYVGTRWEDHAVKGSLRHFEVYEVAQDGTMQLISEWKDDAESEYAHSAYLRDQLLFRLEKGSSDWILSSTALDGSGEQVWLSSGQLPEELRQQSLQFDSMELIDDTLYIPCWNSGYLVAAAPDAPPSCWPLGKGVRFLGYAFASSSFYYTNGDGFMVLDLTTGEHRLLAPRENFMGIEYPLFHVEEDRLWFDAFKYTDEKKRDVRYCLCAINTRDGSIEVCRETVFLGESGVYIYDGYLYYLTMSECWTGGEWGEGTRLHDLWELPLSAVLEDTTTPWEEFTVAHARSLANDVTFDQYNPSTQDVLFGEDGLWLCSMPATDGFPYGQAFYYPYAH